MVRHGDGREFPLEHEHEGIWVGVLPDPEVPDYRLEVSYEDGHAHAADDAYRYLPTLGEVDLHLINEGRHERLWEVLGARVHHYDPPLGEPVSGTAFAVWAPSARGVRLKGDFNGWDGREHPLRQLGQSGVWELFVPGVGTGTGYKYSILGADGQWREKADPMAFYAEPPPDTASKVFESQLLLGRPGLDGHPARPSSTSTSRCRSTRCTWRRGAATRAGTTWPTSCRRTSPTSASPTSS